MATKKKHEFKNSHIEYHTINPHKEKAADCIYLNAERICRNKESPMYDRKCFVASCCSFRIREKVESELSMASSSSSHKKKRVICTLTKGTKVRHKIQGEGNFLLYENDRIYVQFGGKTAVFQYPESFLNGYLQCNEATMEIVRRDCKAMNREWKYKN